MGRLDGKEVGYYELELQNDGSIEIVNFGLLSNFIGQKLGSVFLSCAIDSAWTQPGTKRVWLHTCTEDHEYALDNYEKRGFNIFKTEKKSLG